MSDLAKTLIDEMNAKGLKLAAAESCTGGLIGAAITDIPGSSAIFDRGFITYSNQAKTEMLGVSSSIIKKNGAVSEPVAKAMASGALKNSYADVAVSCTGVAGPGQSEDKPAGLVFIAVARKGFIEAECHQHNFTGNRDDVRKQTVEAALKHVLRII